MKKPTKDIWFEEGLSILQEIGEAGLTIDLLTRRLGKTKGAFYHHFKNRKVFSEQLLAYWEKRMTLEVIDESNTGKSFAEKNLALIQLSNRLSNPELEVAIRAWALRDNLARDYQQRVDNSRLTYLENLFGLLSTNPEKTDIMAMIRYCFYIGSQQIIPRLSDQTYKTLSDSLQEMFENNIENKE